MGAFSSPTLDLCLNVTFFPFEIGNLGGLEEWDIICLKRRTTFGNRTVGTLSKKLARQWSDLHFVGDQATANSILYRIWRTRTQPFPSKTLTQYLSEHVFTNILENRVLIWADCIFAKYYQPTDLLHLAGVSEARSCLSLSNPFYRESVLLRKWHLG